MSPEQREDFSEMTAAFVTEDDAEDAADTDADATEEGEGAVPEPEAPPAPGAKPARFRPGHYVALGAATALLVASAAFGVYYTQAVDRTSAREEAVTEVAERFVRNLTSFDYRTLDDDLAAIRQDATGNFRGELETVLGGDITVFRETITEAEAHSEGRVYAVVVSEVAGERATVQAFVDQTVRNKENPEPRTVLRRIELTLIETTQGWKVDEVKAPGLGPG